MAPSGSNWGSAQAWSSYVPEAVKPMPPMPVQQSWTLGPETGEVSRIREAPAWFNLDAPLSQTASVMMSQPPPPPAPIPSPHTVATTPHHATTAPTSATIHAPPTARQRLPHGGVTWAPEIYPPGLSAYDGTRFGPRNVGYAPVCVPEQNNGVVINAEYPTQEWQVGVLQSSNDDSIRNKHWRHVGQQLRRGGMSVEEMRCQYLHQHADYSSAVDLKAELIALHPKHRPAAHYAKLAKRRDVDGVLEAGLRIRENLRREILNASDIQEFFSNREAVMYDSIR